VDIDWAVVAEAGTAIGTVVLAIATFVSTRTANREARNAEKARLEALRPILMPSQLEDTAQKVSFADDVWLRVEGGRAAIRVDGYVYVVLSLRNIGQGLAVQHGWSIPEDRLGEHVPPERFHRLTRDLYVAPNYVGFTQVISRDRDSAEYDALRRAVERDTFWIDLLYGDLEGSQRVITRFAVSRFRHEDDEGDIWVVGAVRHWNVDLPDPR
jgi:hypothetical protein